MARLNISTLIVLIVHLITGQLVISKCVQAIDSAKSNVTTVNSPLANVATNVSSTDSVSVFTTTIAPTLEKRVGNYSGIDLIVSTSNVTSNSSDLGSAESQARFRVADPGNYHHHHHPHHRHRHHHHHDSLSRSGRRYSDNYQEPYQEVVSDSEESIKKEDPDYGHHYDSDGHRYDFGYDVKDKEGALTFRKESGDAKSLKGSYGIREPDGRLRIVRYVADEKGFRAKVETNEPGTGSEDAANVYFNGYDAEKIPSHDVVHKDNGQHSFKHGHYNSNTGLDSALIEESSASNDDPTSEDIGRAVYHHHHHHDQIPMEINAAKDARIIIPVKRPLTGSLMDHDDDIHADGYNHYKDRLYSYSALTPFRYPPTTHRYPTGPIYTAFSSPPKRRIDRHMIKYRKIPHLTFNIPYNTLTGFYRHSLF